MHSLRTKDAATARILALQFNEAYERKRHMSSKLNFPSLDDIAHNYELDISRGIMKADNQADHALMMQAIEAYRATYGTNPPMQEAMAYGKTVQAFTPPRPIAKSMPFSEIVTSYLAEKKLDNVAATLTEKGRTYKDFIAIFGDLEINLYTKAELVQWKTTDIGRGLQANRINKRLGQVNDLFNWAINHGHYTSQPTSPVDGLFISSKSKLAAKTEHREPFTNDDLKTIFSVGYIKKMEKPDHYWLPLVLAFSGARREEIASLQVKNMKTVDGVPSFLIEDGKTADARRVVPVHPTLLALGFMDYASAVNDMGEAFLFPHLINGANGRGKNAGRQFGLWLDACNIKDDRKVMHSFRHTVITRLHGISADPAHILQIAGHRSEAQGIHYNTYTHDMGLKALQDTLSGLKYPLDFELVRLEDPKFTKFLTKWKMTKDRKVHKPKLKTVTKGGCPEFVLHLIKGETPKT